ncbi:hypothetical protein [Mycobacterium sp.]|uniref:hypothetical protein n=1 Tax=Mycobacterium sp. TaxID=1785 RepID=UPI002C1FE81F|nr:hypothetical protein [Mycobacterium sp.]HKP42111.1 hypothetical protein [Mycobacterium sp.]
MSDQPDSDKRLELAYDAAEKRLTLQDTTLSNVRTRANNLLAATAVFISFATGIGMINTDPKKGILLPVLAGLVLLAIVIAVGVNVLMIMWPVKDWCYVPSAKVIMDMTNAGDDENAIRRHVIDKMIQGAAANGTMLADKQNKFRWVVGLVGAEIAVLAVILLLRLGAMA